jgi:hypothetical protein
MLLTVGAVVLVAVLVIVLLDLLIRKTVEKDKEGFSTDTAVEDVENPVSPQEFSYALLQSVMGPIRRLSSRLTDVSMWSDRIRLAGMSPDELARDYMKRQQQQQEQKAA